MNENIEISKVETLSNIMNGFDYNSLFAAFIGGLFALIGVLVSEYLTRRRNKEEEEYRTENFLKNIKMEINTLFGLYNEKMGVLIRKQNVNEPIAFFYIVEQEYFTIYTNNSNLLGNIQNDNLRASIIRCYSKAKQLIDTFQINNRMLEKLELAVSMKNKEFITSYTLVLTQNTSNIMMLHDELTEEIRVLNDLLKKKNI